MVFSRYCMVLKCLLFLFLTLFVPIQASGETVLKRHKVTVGMYNTYSIKDGNLGQSEPDLKEVWAGIPDISGYEACNITMHYWPRPGDLPEVKPGENNYSAWWKAYMEEAYNLTNQKGEVRLRVIVGPLYSYYEAYKGKTFDGFIEDLCRWEKGSKYEGTLAGWYLAEEPMGSTHNYDPDICNEMAKTIKEIEKSAGVPQHSMYMDVAISGLYYSPSSLAAFLRMVDVVMISASPFLWTTSSQQPVYETSWKRIHYSMKQVRDIVSKDRNNLPRPEIHVVLEARDAIGHGQPTNWEIRQQIHDALSYSLTYEDPPADGIWFFWWSEIGLNRKNNTDDWNYGRRVAEAIQLQVPRSTFAESPWVKRVPDPDKTRFKFPEHGSFNPNSSCIPYDLAEPGYVRIEVFNEKMSLVEKFDMKYQVSGSLQRFGGPYWRRSSTPNGIYIFRLYLDSKLVDEVKTKVQWSIMVNSTSHQPGIWSNVNTITVQWEPQTEELKGLSGYSVLWDTSRISYPDTEIDLTDSVTSLKSPPLPDGDSNYFHICSVDGTGIWSIPDHLGPFYIDTTEPGSVKDPVSDTHRIGEWSKDNRIIVRWNPAEDGTSGLMGYSILWDTAPGALPDKEIYLASDATMLASEPLADGMYYLHIRSVDNAGNWSHTAAHIGPFLIDSIPPQGVADLVSSSHTPGQWSKNDIVMLSWKSAEDQGSGIAGYSILWDNYPNTIPVKSINMDKKTSAISPSLESSKEQFHYFHINSADKTGNWSADVQHLGPFMIDAKPPPKVDGLVSTSHKPDEWSSNTKVDVVWKPAEDVISGVAGYEWNLSSDEFVAEEWKRTFQASLHIPQLKNGLWYIHVRAVDNAGNMGASDHILVRIDSEPPPPLTVWSSSHPDSDIWYTSPEAIFEWTGDDKISGIDGYNWSWDTDAMTIPDAITESAGILPRIRFTVQSPGVWYFHLRAVDKAGNWSISSHYKIQVDPSAPSAPQITSDIHKDGQWSSISSVRLNWETPAPGPSGVVGYSFALDQNPISTPEEVLTDSAVRVDYSSLPDGIWYFHCRAKGGSGVWGPAAHYEIRIDTTQPGIFVTYPQSDSWYTTPVTQYSGAAYDRSSGVDWGSFEYSYNGGTWKTFHPQREDDDWSDSREIPHCNESIGDTLQVRVRDLAGNMAVSILINIRVDRSASPPAVVSSTHPDQDKWYISNDPDFAWSFIDKVSGADGYSWALDHSEYTIPPQARMIEGYITYKTDLEGLTDGIWYFHLRGKDRAGNWSETSHYRVKIDSTPPIAKIKISGPAVINSDPPLARSGPVEVLLQTTEAVFDPVLEYRPASATSPVPIKLAAEGDVLKGAFNVTTHTGDGKVDFLFSAKDEAGNIGRDIAAGGYFMIDTLIHADAGEASEVLCVTEPDTRLSLPSGSIMQDLRVEIVKSVSGSSGVIAVYDFIPYDSRMRRIKDIILRIPAEITFSPQPGYKAMGVYYWDGVKWHKVQDIRGQDAYTTVRVDYLGRFALMKTEPAASEIMYGWAAPNPFTPNGSGDATDRTIFHVATRYGSNDFTVNIYDLNGRLVKCLDKGIRTWDGSDEDGRIVEGGLYIYQIHSEDQIISGTVVVLK